MKIVIALCVALITLGSVPSYGDSLVKVDKFNNITTFETLYKAIAEHREDFKKREHESTIPPIPEPSPDNQKIGISSDKWCKKYQNWPGCIDNVINGIQRDHAQPH